MVEIVAHNPLWTRDFEREAQAVARAFGTDLVALHHIGSTAIVGIYAKPVIDMLAVAGSLDALEAATPALCAQGYQAMGPYGIEGRRYFRKNGADGRRSHHLHGYARGSVHIDRHLAFRDYLRAHPAIAQQYSTLKQQLVARNEDYIEGKTPFVLATQDIALAWYRAQTRGY